MIRDKAKMNALFRILLLTLAGSFVYAMYSGIRGNYGIMLRSIIDHSGISFASVSFILAVGQLIYGLVQPAFGILAAKYGSAVAFVSGMILTVTGLFFVPYCKSPASLMLCLGIVLPAGTGAVSYGLVIGTVTPGLPPGTAPTISGVVNASSGIGNTVLSPVIDRLIRIGGLPHSMRMLTIPTFLTLPVALLMIRSRKSTRQVEAAENSASPASTTKISAREMLAPALRNKTYLRLMAGFFTCGFHMALITNHLPTQIRSFGFSSEATAYAFSIYGIITMVSSIASGNLCGRFKMKTVLGCFYGLRPLTILAFLLVPKTLFTVTLFTALFGISGAATVPPVSGLVRKVFGITSLATLYGFVFFIHQIGGFFGAWLGGLCYNLTGSYTGIWMVAAVFGAFASIISFAVED